MEHFRFEEGRGIGGDNRRLIGVGLQRPNLHGRSNESRFAKTHHPEAGGARRRQWECEVIQSAGLPGRDELVSSAGCKRVTKNIRVVDLVERYSCNQKARGRSLGRLRDSG